MPGAQTQAPPVSPEGLPLCRWCHHLVRPPKITFCSDKCVHEWRLRTDGGYLRRCLFARDRGVCACCGLNTLQLYHQFRTEMKPSETRKAVRECWKSRGWPVHRTSFWEADHILEVVNGGGECDLGNYQTLCVPCHKKKTAQHAHERAAMRRLAKAQQAL
jgi:hypothetical protein